MLSFCVKTNNKNIINYLLNECKNMNLDNIILSNRTFKNYENVIIHYLGNQSNLFYNSLSEILSNCIITFYEKDLLKKLININYFYFTSIEQKQILNNCIQYLEYNDDFEMQTREQDLFVSVLKYIIENKSMILDGFVNFRISNYVKTLDACVDSGVNRFLIEREYNEFITLLKLYINSKKSGMDIMHLIYFNEDSILIDDDKNIIKVEDNIFNAKYLSDITFSSNDYALNTLLSIIPQKLIIHLVDNNSDDEFINTLKLIFENRIVLCTDCIICETYRISNKIKMIKK